MSQPDKISKTRNEKKYAKILTASFPLNLACLKISAFIFEAPFDFIIRLNNSIVPLICAIVFNCSNSKNTCLDKKET